MTDVAITENAIESLRAAVAGPVLTPDQDGYAAEITGFEMAVEHAPAIAIGATDADDVVATVRTAAGAGIPVAVVGHGHAAIPTVSTGILLNISRITDVTLDVGARTVRVGAGATWHDVMAVATPIGLAPVCGSSPGVGVAGYLLGGAVSTVRAPTGTTITEVSSVSLAGVAVVALESSHGYCGDTVGQFKRSLVPCGDLYLANLTTGTLTPLTNPDGAVRNALFGSDGSMVLQIGVVVKHTNQTRYIFSNPNGKVVATATIPMNGIGIQTYTPGHATG
jgi:hypothetical protein